jgi:protein SCO1/2
MTMGASRRTILLGASAAVAGALAPVARAHNSAGVVEPPEAPPATRLTLADGRDRRLADLLVGRVTALQLIFTRCQATCPIQGALFGRAVRVLGDGVGDAQWLSLTIDPAHDTLPILRGWLARYGAGPRWRAARPAPADLPPLLDFLNARSGGVDNHTAMRSIDFPPVETVVRNMRTLAAR